MTGAVMLSACSTKKNTFIRRTYHNLTAHYNVYWNGMDNLRQGVKEHQAALKDNYALVLPVFNYGDKASASKLSQYGDIAIKKASKAINKHSMVFNRKEYVRWIDDSYMLIGTSYFYKQDYPMARRTFEFVIKTYNDNDIKYEAMLWQAKSNIQIGDFKKAEPMLDMLQSKINKGDAPQKYETELNLVYGQFFIMQKNYEGAIPYLLRALELNPPSAMRTRVHYILGQIYQGSGELSEASAMYEYVTRHAKTYEMEFNAKINLAQCYTAQSGNREYIVKKLKKMLKDDKNKDFQDQICYALAHIAMQDADTSTAIEYYRQSVSTSKNNNYQKAISSLELADIYFRIKEYPVAQAYYDSTMQFLPKEYPNYKELYKRTQTLTDLVKNLEIIQRQDSLQKLAGMTEGQRQTVIDRIISELVQKEYQQQLEEQQRREAQYLYSQQGLGQEIMTGESAAGRWYFYNPTTMSNGFSTFTRKWGRRKLEDNWFLSNKASTAFTEETGKGEPKEGAAGDSLPGGKKALAKANNPKERDYYLKDIPLTKEKIQASNEMIIEAYYQAGFIFAEGLGDYGNAIRTFESLLTRFPDCKYKIQSAYELCVLYAQLQNQPMSDQYRNQILTRYPDSDYAKLLVNPNYYKELSARQSEASLLYNDTYRAYVNQQYYMVINNSAIARSRYKADTVLMPKFDYLRAMALGKIEVVDSLVVAMNQVIRDHPRSSVRPLAENVLAYLSTQKNSKGQPIQSDTTKTAPAGQEKLYAYDPTAMHFYVLIVNEEMVDVDALKIKISDYNARFHSLENLAVNSLVFDSGRQMITVSNFDNSESANNYFIGILGSKYIFTKLENAGEYANFIISVDNYPILYKNKDIRQYMRFYEKNYPAENK